MRSVDDIRSVLEAGADKVSLNTAAIRDPNLIRDAAHEFGSSTVVIAIEAIRQITVSILHTSIMVEKRPAWKLLHGQRRFRSLEQGRSY